MFCSGRQNASFAVVANSKKTDMSKQGLNSIKNAVVKNNLMGVSKKMEDKNWTDSQGRKGKVREPIGPDMALLACCTSSTYSKTSCSANLLLAVGHGRVQVRQEVRRQRGRLLPYLHTRYLGRGRQRVQAWDQGPACMVSPPLLHANLFCLQLFLVALVRQSRRICSVMVWLSRFCYVQGWLSHHPACCGCHPHLLHLAAGILDSL